ncbi:unnamed protein product, partial [Didymodactylos carnosus]
VDMFCDPKLINRLFYLYFETKRRTSLTVRDYNSENNQFLSNNDGEKEQENYVELLAHFCSMNGPIHKNQLSLELTDVLYEKELMSQFSRVLDRHSSIGLLSVYLTLTDVLNDIPLASDILVRKKIFRRLKHITDIYLNPDNGDSYIFIPKINNSDTESENINEKLIKDIKQLIYNDTLDSTNTMMDINDDNDKGNLIDDEKKMLGSSQTQLSPFDIQYTFTLLSRFHCKIYELLEEKYQRCFLKSDEHFLYICGKRMDSSDYTNTDFDQKQDGPKSRKGSIARRYTTTSYADMEEKDEFHLKCPEDTTSIGSNSSSDENIFRDLSLWRVIIPRAEECRDNNTSTKYCILIIEIQRLDTNNGDITMTNDDESSHWSVTRRYQDFYLLESKLIEFHGIFDDARLPPKRSFVTKNMEFLESVKQDFERFLRHLLTKPTLRNSELLHTFLTQPGEFNPPSSELILSKVFKVVPRKLRIEKGQYLDPFLISLLNYVEPSKPKSSELAPTFSDLIEEKLKNPLYNNNVNITNPCELLPTDNLSAAQKNPLQDDLDSAYENLTFIVAELFSASPNLIDLLEILRLPLKNTFDTFFTNYIDQKVDDLLADEENIIDVIHALRDALFPNEKTDLNSTNIITFDDVVTAAADYLPNYLKFLIGKKNIQHGIQLIFQYFQDPLLNKQLFYMILDEILLELFPELQTQIHKRI